MPDVLAGQRVAIEPVIRKPGDDDHYNLGAAFYGLMAHGFLAETAVAETAVVPESAVHILPDRVSLQAGALTEPVAVAWHAAVRTGLVPGQAGLVFGGGPIGLGTAMSLRARGIDRILVVEPSASRREIHQPRPARDIPVQTNCLDGLDDSRPVALRGRFPIALANMENARSFISRPSPRQEERWQIRIGVREVSPVLNESYPCLEAGSVTSRLCG